MLHYWKSNRITIVLITLLCFLLNWNTLRNGYALDDKIIIHQNLNVQDGFSGIPAIMRTDAFQGYLDLVGAESPLTGGRYRPLSIVTFAVEQSVFGKTLGREYRAAVDSLKRYQSDPKVLEKTRTRQLLRVDRIKEEMMASSDRIAPVRHFIQLLIFVICMISLHLFLSTCFFRSKPWLALLTVLLFVAHPVHTEVIANIKSRDELLSLLFIVLTLFYSFQYVSEQTRANLYRMLICFVLALLSKEYAIILPFMIVVGWTTVLKVPFRKVFNSGLWLLGLCVAIFVFIRFSLLSQQPESVAAPDVLNDPYLYATGEQAFASKIAILPEYFRVLLFPVHLSSDYSYSHFAYIGYSHWKFILGILLYFGAILWTYFCWRKRSELTFPLVLFLGFLFLINNFFFNLGATMGERLIFHSSLGFCLLVTLLLEKVYARYAAFSGSLNYVVWAMSGVVLFLFGMKTIERNPAWQSDYVLSYTDVQTNPNSALLNSNAATEIYNKAFSTFVLHRTGKEVDSVAFKAALKKALPFFDKALRIHPRYVVAYQNRGLCYFRLNELEKAGADWMKASDLLGGSNDFLRRNSYVYYDQGVKLGAEKRYSEAVNPLFVASHMNPDDAKIWNNLGGAYFMTGQFALSVDAFTMCITIDPQSQDAVGGKNAATAIYLLEEKYLKDTADIATRNELRNAYQSCGVQPALLRVKL